jgi:hypothetical protein
MVLMKKFLWVAIAGFLAVHCAADRPLIYGTNYDYDETATFSSLMRYRWEPLPKTSVVDPLNVKRIKRVADDILQSKGRIEVQERPDFVIATLAVTSSRIDNTGGFDEYGLYKEGRLRLSFLDPKNGEILWWGETRLRLQPGLQPQEKDRRIFDAVAEILQHFPPAAS